MGAGANLPDSPPGEGGQVSARPSVYSKPRGESDTYGERKLKHM